MHINCFVFASTGIHYPWSLVSAFSQQIETLGKGGWPRDWERWLTRRLGKMADQEMLLKVFIFTYDVVNIPQIMLMWFHKLRVHGQPQISWHLENFLENVVRIFLISITNDAMSTSCFCLWPDLSCSESYIYSREISELETRALHSGSDFASYQLCFMPLLV